MPIEATSADRTPVNLFYAYAEADEALRQELENHLTSLKREGLIAPWHKGSISAGSNWQEEITTHLNSAQVILLLISASFLASDFCESALLDRVIERYNTGQVLIIPIILRPCDWQNYPFGKLRSLPDNNKSVTEWPNRDSAFLNVAHGLRQAISAMLLSASQTQQQSDVPNPSQKIFTIPFAQNPYFTGREDILNQLHNALNNNKTAALTQAIAGLGGIGKTQTAVEYAYRHQDDYSHIFWLRAEKRENLNSDLAALATPLNLPVKDVQEQPRIVEAVKEWLDDHTGWLLILDNADDLQMAKDFIPSRSKGHIILTTRAQVVGRLAQKVEIEKMDLEEGARFLLHRANFIDADALLDTVSPDDVAQAKEIVQVLDGLPLALEQAAAYIEENECGLTGYLQRYQTQRNFLLQYRGDFISEHPEPVATTWKLSFQRVEEANAAAADLLRLCAFLAPDAIPEEIITEGADELRPDLQAVASDEVKLDAAIKELRKYSLLKRDPDGHVLHIHGLVQAVLKDEMDEEIQRQWAELAMRAVNSAFPDAEYKTWPECERLLPHARMCVELTEQWDMMSAEAAEFLNHIAVYLWQRAQFTEAEPLYKKALLLRENLFGLEHLDVASSLNNLATVYEEQGKYSQAEQLFRQALVIREQLLGPEHPTVATSLNNLARLYLKQDKYYQAEQLLHRVPAIYEKAFGLEHRWVATSLTNLATLYRKQGRYSQAESLFEQALAILEKVLEPEHPDVAISLNNLATIYRAQGKYSQVEPLLKRAVAIKEKALGLYHPSLANSLTNLADFYSYQRRYAEAESLYQRALAIREKVFGPQHPDVATILEKYVKLLKKTNREDEATKLLERARAIRAKHAQENLTTSD